MPIDTNISHRLRSQTRTSSASSPRQRLRPNPRESRNHSKPTLGLRRLYPTFSPSKTCSAVPTKTSANESKSTRNPNKQSVNHFFANPCLLRLWSRLEFPSLQRKKSAKEDNSRDNRRKSFRNSRHYLLKAFKHFIQNHMFSQNSSDDSSCGQMWPKKSKPTTTDDKFAAEEEAKDSFSRFGDDLCEELLSLLSIEDSFRCQCVCLQWRRSVFRRKSQLELNDQLFSKWQKVDLFGRQYVESERLVSLLKKCSFVEHISVSPTLSPIDGVLALITTYCPRLRSIAMDFEKVSSKEFFAEFGPKVKSIRFITDSFAFKKTSRNWRFFRDLKLCTKLSALNTSSVHNMSTIFDENDEIFVANLKRFEFRCDLSQDMNRFRVFVANNSESLRVLRLESVSNGDQRNGNELTKHLLSLRALTELSLNFGFNFIASDKHFVQTFRQLSLKSNALMKLTLHLSYKSVSQVSALFHAVKYFRHLRSLRLSFNRFDDTVVESDVYLSAKTLNACKRITHLRLSFGAITLKDFFFADIGVDLPKLRTLRVDSRAEITDATLESVANLPKLESIDLSVAEKAVAKLSDSSVARIVRKCPAITSISIRSKRSKARVLLTPEMIADLRNGFPKE